MMADLNVQLLNFKSGKAREMVVPNEDGSYTIFINEQLSPEARMDAYNHALHHINHNDFDKYDVQDIEATAHYQAD